MVAAGLIIRPVGEAERAAWEPLWIGYQTFYKVSLSDEVNTVTWQRLHDPAEPMGLLGAYLDDRLVGIAHWIEHRSCWSVGNYVYLQDLFVAPDARGHGIGRALIEAVCDTARGLGASRVHWLTHESNTDARALYDKVAERPGFIQYRKIF